jgi:DNA-binding CsgD family transcriptional regulator
MSYEWMDQALCAQVGPDVFFPEVGDSGTTRTAKTFCAACPVRPQCQGHVQRLEGGIAQGLRHGTWGATTPQERVLIGGETPSAERDREVIRLSARGLGPSEIAARLGCSDRTVARVLATARRTGAVA